MVVNDVSGSTDDNCGEDGVAQPGETPCKINDMKNASTQFVNLMIQSPNNRIGLVNYSTNVKGFVPLSADNATLANAIDSYKATGLTCISCGIDKGIEIANAGTNPKKVIVLMSDGEANRCISGICTPITAKQEAKGMAPITTCPGSSNSSL